MAGTNWKYEAGASACMRFWSGLKERYTEEGLTAPAGAQCPYPETSFAALHWRRGAAETSNPEERTDETPQPPGKEAPAPGSPGRRRGEPDPREKEIAAGKAALARIRENL